MAERKAGQKPAAAAGAAGADDELADEREAEREAELDDEREAERDDEREAERADEREAELADERDDRAAGAAAALIATAPSPAPELRPTDDDLPVVARLIVEIRSDGSRTIARGALEDANLGQRVAVEARGDSPLALALALAKSIGSMTASLTGKQDGTDRPRLPRLSARAALRGLLGRRKK